MTFIRRVAIGIKSSPHRPEKVAQTRLSPTFHWRFVTISRGWSGMALDIRIFSGTAHPELADDIVSYLGVRKSDLTVTQFPDGETFVKINENIRGRDIFIVQPTCPPTNENLMELLIMVDAARRASAARITAVIPFFGYARQDRKDQPRVPITAKLVANLLTDRKSVV